MLRLVMVLVWSVTTGGGAFSPSFLTVSDGVSVVRYYRGRGFQSFLSYG